MRGCPCVSLHLLLCVSLRVRFLMHVLVRACAFVPARARVPVGRAGPLPEHNVTNAAMVYGGDEMNRSKYVALFAGDIDPRMPAAAYLDGGENENELNQLIGQVWSGLRPLLQFAACACVCVCIYAWISCVCERARVCVHASMCVCTHAACMLAMRACMHANAERCARLRRSSKRTTSPSRTL